MLVRGNDCNPATGAVLFDQCLEGFLRLAVEPVERFVQQPDGTPPVEQAGQRGAFLLACGKIAYRHIHQRSKLEQFERAPGFSAAIDPLPESQRLAEWKVRIESESFVHQTHGALAIHFAGIGSQESGKDAHEAGFAYAIRAGDMARIARTAFERESTKQQPLPAAAGNILGDEASLHGQGR